jgi:protein SCO1/2
MKCFHRRAAFGALAAVTCLVLSGCASGVSAGTDQQTPSAPSAAIGSRVDHPLPRGVRNLPLVDARGTPTPLTVFRGKVIVISDMMTLCQETCPMDTSAVVKLARAAQKAGLGKDVEFLSITIDPSRDTPAQLTAYRKLFAPAPSNWETLTGPPGAVKRLWKTLGVWIKKVPQDSPPPRNWRTGKVLTYDLDHGDEVFFLNSDYHERFVLDGVPHVNHATEVPRVLRKFLNDDGHKNLATPPSSAWTVPQAEKVLRWLTGHQM